MHMKQVNLFLDDEECRCEQSTLAAFGCNADNGNPGRTVNANNSVSNHDNNFGGAFAISKPYNAVRLLSAEKTNLTEKEVHIARPTRPNNDGMHIAAGEYAQCDYKEETSTLDVLEKNNEEVNEYLENNEIAGRDPLYYYTSNIWSELKIANSKRKLKNLIKFYRSHEIAVYAVKRCCKAKDTPKKKRYLEKADIVADWMIRVINHKTYKVQGFITTTVLPRFSTGKVRHPKVFTLFDRCVQMFVLTIIEQKLKRKVIRNNYSNIEGRGIYCKDKRYCMLNQIRTANWKYPNDTVLITDIKKFYETTNWKIVCDELFKTIKDYTTRTLIAQTMEAAKTMPIGSCLSPLLADLILQDYDEIVLTKFKPDFYAIYGDDRIFWFRNKKDANKVLSYSISYYAGRYGLDLKENAQIRPNINFSFCKKQYENGYCYERREIVRRGIKTAKCQKRFAGYYGMFVKTDSKHLLHLIKDRYKALRKRTY